MTSKVFFFLAVKFTYNKKDVYFPQYNPMDAEITFDNKEFLGDLSQY